MGKNNIQVDIPTKCLVPQLRLIAPKHKKKNIFIALLALF